jgi:hypothetical protein
MLNPIHDKLNKIFGRKISNKQSQLFKRNKTADTSIAYDENWNKNEKISNFAYGNIISDEKENSFNLSN